MQSFKPFHAHTTACWVVVKCDSSPSMPGKGTDLTRPIPHGVLEPYFQVKGSGFTGAQFSTHSVSPRVRGQGGRLSTLAVMGSRACSAMILQMCLIG